MSYNCNGEHNHSHGLHEGCQCNDAHHGNMDMIYLTLEDGSELKCEERAKLSIIEDDNEFNKVAEVYNSMIEGEIAE